MLPSPSIPLVRVRDRHPDPLDYRRVRKALAHGEAIRVAPGTFASAAQWRGLKPIEQHRVRVYEAASRVRDMTVFSHHAAAAVWGIDVLGSWPQKVDTRVERAPGGRSTGLMARHALGVEGIDLQPWSGHLLTSPVQTAIDLAAALPYTSGVVCLDQALWRRRADGPLATFDELMNALSAPGGLRGAARAERALRFATDASDSVRESQSRVLIHALGFPPPVLQHPFLLPSGRRASVDFFFEDYSHAGEFDGTGKYLDPALLAGRTPEQALLDEKDRGDELRRVVSVVSRWRTPALRDPRMLYDILSGDGLPSSRQRPPAGLRWQ